MINASGSLKARIKNIAKEKRVSSHLLLQNYMFERFLKRLSLSSYRDNFVIKGRLSQEQVECSKKRGIQSKTLTPNAPPKGARCYLPVTLLHFQHQAVQIGAQDLADLRHPF